MDKEKDELMERMIASLSTLGNMLFKFQYQDPDPVKCEAISKHIVSIERAIQRLSKYI